MASLRIGVGLFTAQLPGGSERTFSTEYRDIIELARVVEESGLDGVWVSEHHGSADGYLPSLLPLLAAMASVTDRVELGTGVVLAPLHDPLRLAEDFAVVDQISGGRTVCGLGVGWREEEFRMFGVPVAERVGRLSETVAILRHAWTGERFSFNGKHYTYDQVAVTPAPARVPPILLGGFVDAAIRRAGQIADGYISSRVPAARAGEAFRMAADARRGAGGEGPPIVAILHNAFVTKDPDKDWPMIAAGAGHQFGVYAGWRAGTDVPGVDLQVMHPDEATLRSTTAFGTPEQVVEQLTELCTIMRPYDEAHLIVRLHYPGMAPGPAADAIRLFAEQVAPRLRSIAGSDGE